MKTLQETLFDTTKNIEKDITFGDVYKPIYITSTNSDEPFRKIANVFSLSKLRKIAKRVDLSGVKQNTPYDNDHIEVIELIVGIISKLPLKDDLNYGKEIYNTFKSLTRYWMNGVMITLNTHRFHGDERMHLVISRSSANEFTAITIYFA